MINIFKIDTSNPQHKKYVELLRLMGSLSNLFSNSEIPFLHYRVAENIFCKSFEAENLSRSDIAYDAKIDKKGIGIKTFISTSNSKTEKIAEFNEYSSELRKLSDINLAHRLSELRNERIEFANRIYGIEKAFYHCISRKKRLLNIFYSDYNLINIDSLCVESSDKSSLKFNDGKNKYVFNFSKSTLFRNFKIPGDCFKINIEIIKEPYDLLSDLFEKYYSYNNIAEPSLNQERGKDFVFLPLYSTRSKEKYVPEKSALNQWNANGRKRNYGEVYIPIPRKIHKLYPKFFPTKDKIFNLHIPTGEVLKSKLCQENSKALMTNPNNALSDWMLRKVFHLKEGQLLTYEILKSCDIDSVLITKIDKNNFKIDFAKIGSYSRFIGG